MSTIRKIEWFVLAMLLTTVVFAYFNVERVIVRGVSMQPTFLNGQNVFVWTRVPKSSLKVGDVIVLHSDDNSDLIKRIVFIQNASGTEHPPDTVWTPLGPQKFSDLFADYNYQVSRGQLPKPDMHHTIYVMGDNFRRSEDSRVFGPIDPRKIIGKVFNSR
jgi:signal peptidase I